VLQEVLSRLFYSPEILIACRPQILLILVNPSLGGTIFADKVCLQVYSDKFLVVNLRQVKYSLVLYVTVKLPDISLKGQSWRQ